MGKRATIASDRQLKAAVGDGYGVQAAAYFCRYIKLYYNGKVEFLLGTNIITFFQNPFLILKLNHSKNRTKSNRYDCIPDCGQFDKE